jgi:hypothetical protein
VGVNAIWLDLLERILPDACLFPAEPFMGIAPRLIGMQMVSGKPVAQGD